MRRARTGHRHSHGQAIITAGSTEQNHLPAATVWRENREQKYTIGKAKVQLRKARRKGCHDASSGSLLTAEKGDTAKG